MSIRIAAKHALKSKFEQHRLGAVIVKGHRILSTGYNSKRFSSVIGTRTLHAEAAAVIKLLKARRLSDLTGADIYVTRFTKGGSVGMSRPCDECYKLCKSVGIRRIYFTDSTGVTKCEHL